MALVSELLELADVGLHREAGAADVGRSVQRVSGEGEGRHLPERLVTHAR